MLCYLGTMGQLYENLHLSILNDKLSISEQCHMQTLITKLCTGADS